jgi:hypothetical protein
MGKIVLMRQHACMHARKGDECKDLIIKSYAPYTIDVKHETFASP